MPNVVPTVGYDLTFPVDPRSVVNGEPVSFENVFCEISDPTLASVLWDGLVRVTPLGPTGTATLTVRIDLKIGGGEVLQYATAEIAFVDPATFVLGDGTLEPTS